ncbi:uncharacterized protein [Physcomitrium patens]|uniref:uncharacterized protein isoform X2 n=1 Tax=Physcomitrium patens TaxID=3218 RepID=UPI003CCE4CA0
MPSLRSLVAATQAAQRLSTFRVCYDQSKFKRMVRFAGEDKLILLLQDGRLPEGQMESLEGTTDIEIRHLYTLSKFFSLMKRVVMCMHTNVQC